jgi:hypothetical protein
MVVGQGTGRTVGHPFLKSIVAGARIAIAEGAEDFKPVVDKDPEPLVQLAALNPQQVSDVF